MAARRRIFCSGLGHIVTFFFNNLIALTQTSFFTEVERVGQPDYVPSELDLLLVRVKTTGIIDLTWEMRNIQFRYFKIVFLCALTLERLVDVGGQRNERRKWIHCFEKVTAVLFCASLNEYVLREHFCCSITLIC